MGQRNQASRLAVTVGRTTAAFATALARGDTGTACAVYTEDALLLPPAAGPMRGRAAIESFWRAGLAAGLVALRFQAFTLKGGGSLAYEVGRYELRLKPPDGAALAEHGTYLLVHLRQSDGSWRWAAEALSPGEAGRPATDSASRAFHLTDPEEEDGNVNSSGQCDAHTAAADADRDGLLGVQDTRSGHRP